MTADRRLVLLASLGGTIAMKPDPQRGGSMTPALGGADLAALIARYDLGAEVRIVDIANTSSASIAYKSLIKAVRAAERAVGEGAVGVVVTQGTDGIEETAFAIDLMWRHDAPIAVTGSMYNADDPGWDGTRNLVDALRVVLSDAARGLGCVTVFDGVVHAARWVRKVSSVGYSPFESTNAAPVARLLEGKLQRLWQPVRRPFAVTPVRTDVRTAVLPAVIGEDGTLFECADGHFDGVVVMGLGAGHVPERTVPAIARLAAQVPVVLSTRAHAGPVLSHTYGYKGSEVDLLRRGLIRSGLLDPFKARILLHLLLAANADRASIREAFAFYADYPAPAT
jgi:L-asparaginase